MKVLLSFKESFHHIFSNINSIRIYCGGMIQNHAMEEIHWRKKYEKIYWRKKVEKINRKKQKKEVRRKIKHQNDSAIV